MHIFWARLASFGHLGLISDPLIVSKSDNQTYDPKGQENNTTLNTIKNRFTHLNFQNETDWVLCLKWG